MAYDEGLAERIRSVLEGHRKVVEKKMFGGVAFMLDGKMFVGIVKDDLLVRVGPERYEDAIKQRHVRPMDFTGKPMVGYVYVVDEDATLARWVALGADFVATLPTKKAPSRPTNKKVKRAAGRRKTRG